MPSRASRSRFEASASPSRRMERSTRVRSSRSSASRLSSWAAIVLNSSPSAANSSLPTVGTLVAKSPPPRRRAASRNAATWACSERDTATPKRMASRKKPRRIPATSQRAVAHRAAGGRGVAQQADLKEPAAEVGLAERGDAVVPAAELDGPAGRNRDAPVERHGAGQHEAAAADHDPQARHVLDELGVLRRGLDRDLNGADVAPVGGQARRRGHDRVGAPDVGQRMAVTAVDEQALDTQVGPQRLGAALDRRRAAGAQGGGQRDVGRGRAGGDSRLGGGLAGEVLGGLQAGGDGGVGLRRARCWRSARR